MNQATLPYDVPALRPGVVVRLTDRTRVPAQTRSFLARVTTVERREGADHLYVGWRQPGPGYGFQAEAGSWGFTHVPDAGPGEWGTIGVEVVTALPREIEQYEQRAMALARAAGEDERAWLAGSPAVDAATLSVTQGGIGRSTKEFAIPAAPLDTYEIVEVYAPDDVIARVNAADAVAALAAYAVQQGFAPYEAGDPDVHFDRERCEATAPFTNTEILARLHSVALRQAVEAAEPLTPADRDEGLVGLGDIDGGGS